MKLSIVSTLYRSEAHLKEFLQRIAELPKKANIDQWEIILVNDGSPDDSLTLAKNLIKTYPNLSVVDLSRNFGHHAAMLQGLQVAKGARVFLIDSDLEEPPECFYDFLNEMDRQGAECVFGVQGERRGGALSKLFGKVLYTAMNAISDVPIPKNLVTARLMTRKFVDGVNEYRERDLSIGIIWANVGFKQVPLSIQKQDTSQTTYNFFKRVNTLLNTVAASGSILLTMVSMVGILIFLSTLGYVSYVFLSWLVYGNNITGWASTIIFLGFLSGFQIFAIGLVGLYVGRIMKEVRQRPRSIIADIWTIKNVD